MKVSKVHQRLDRIIRLFGRSAAMALMAGAMNGELFAQAPAGDLAFLHEGESFAIVDAASVPTVASLHKSGDGPLLQGIGTTVAHSPSCSTCGPSGRGTPFGGGFAAGSPLMSGGMACPSCQPFSYVIAEALFMRRGGDEGFTLGQNFRLDEFDYEWAPRITVGSVPNCVNGWEASFTGIFDWDMRSQVAGANNLDSRLFSLSLPATDLDTFSGASFQSQAYDTDYLSVEASRTVNGWGMSKVIYGLRYIDYEETFAFFSSDPVDGDGFLISDTDNALIGGQIGLDLLYPVARYAYLDFRGRAGAYINLADSDVDVVNNGVSIVSVNNEDEELAGVFEVGSGLRLELGDMLTIRGGAEAWYLAGLATARGQFDNNVDGITRSLNSDSDVIMFGLTFGAELKY